MARGHTTTALSAREEQVLECISWGLTQQEIATLLDVSTKSVETYRKRITLKLGLTMRSELVQYTWVMRLQSHSEEALWACLPVHFKILDTPGGRAKMQGIQMQSQKMKESRALLLADLATACGSASNDVIEKLTKVVGGLGSSR